MTTIGKRGGQSYWSEGGEQSSSPLMPLRPTKFYFMEWNFVGLKGSPILLNLIKLNLVKPREDEDVPIPPTSCFLLGLPVYLEKQETWEWWLGDQMQPCWVSLPFPQPAVAAKSRESGKPERPSRRPFASSATSPFWLPHPLCLTAKNTAERPSAYAADWFFPRCGSRKGEVTGSGSRKTWGKATPCLSLLLHLGQLKGRSTWPACQLEGWGSIEVLKMLDGPFAPTLRLFRVERDRPSAHLPSLLPGPPGGHEWEGCGRGPLGRGHPKIHRGDLPICPR